MQKVLKWITPVVALGVTVFIIFFFISINSVEELDYVEPLTYKSEVVPKKRDKLWLNNFSQTERLGYFYPVNEVYIDVDLNEKILNNTIYKLSASLLDPYQLFCLKEELKQHKLRYYLRRDNDEVELLIYSKNIDKLSSLIKVLKNYQISATMKPYKEDI